MSQPVTKTWPHPSSFFIFVKLREYNLDPFPRFKKRLFLNNKTTVGTGDSEEISSISMLSQGDSDGDPLDGMPPWEMPFV